MNGIGVEEVYRAVLHQLSAAGEESQRLRRIA